MYKQRIVCLVVVEAKTPIIIGSGYKSIFSDAEVATDANGLPYIPGTALAGVLRDGLAEDSLELFGSESIGSRVMLSDGYLVGEDGHAITGIRDNLHGEFYDNYFDLPKREHVRIGERGAAVDTGKFDNRIVYKGSRFCFEIELVCKSEDDGEKFKEVLNKMRSNTFCIGGGSRNGYGALEVKQLTISEYDLTTQIDDYINRTSDLSLINLKDDNDIVIDKDPRYEDLTINITPEDLFIFGSGKESAEKGISQTPTMELVVTWRENLPSFTQEQVVIPGSSIKGVLAHRTLFYINKAVGNFIGTTDEVTIQKSRDIFQLLFGYVDADAKQRGLVMIQDAIKPLNQSLKTMQHVKIDRFTGGTIGGALFAEKVVCDPEDIQINIYMERSLSPYYGLAKSSFMAALEDVKSGKLPLGWGTMKGHGRFQATTSNQ